jgi:hypothetical protein
MAQITTNEQLRAIIADYGPRGAAKIRDHICEQGIPFIERCPFVIMATFGSYGLELSPKGGAPGFVEVLDERTLLIPEYKGNHLAIGLTNLLHDRRVALMLIRPATDEVLRITGAASLHDDNDLCARLAVGGKPALLAIRVDVERAAFHCVRSARRAGLWNPESWDAPTRISFGKIYADALQAPELLEPFDRMTEESDATLY